MMITGAMFSQVSYSAGSWYANRPLIPPIVVTAAATRALWVIVSDQGRQQAEYVQ